MGEPRRSPLISLSPQQLKEGSIYLSQVFLGLTALTQIDSRSLAMTMETLQAQLSSKISDPHSRDTHLGTDLATNINNINSSGIGLNFSQLSDRLLGGVDRNSLHDSLNNSPSNFPGQPLNVQELSFGVQVLVHLCQQHQELIRRSVSLMEQITKEGKNPWQVTLLKDYSQRLAASSSLSSSVHQSPHLSEVESNQWRGKLLFDLLFYSSPYGQQRLWLRCTQPVNIGIT